jgi:hypothetical protein
MTQPAPLLNPKRKPRKKADEGLLLHRFGTDIGSLTPNAVLTAARADLRAKEYNAWLVAERREYKRNGRDPKQLGTKKGYSFLPKHTRAAATPAALLKLAYESRSDAGRTAETSIREPQRRRHLRESERQAHLRSPRGNLGSPAYGRG